MEEIKIIKDPNNNKDPKKKEYFNCYNFIINKSHSILISINFLLTIYLLIQNNRFNALNEDINSTKAYYKNKNINIDKDMVGLKYPEINYKNIKNNSINGKIFSSFIEFLTQIETKLIYLEKEINCTKLITFFTSRKLYLKNMNVPYDDSNITEYHDIINWLIIHKSNILKGIASDKYLACKYVEIKLGKNLCSQRIAVYDKVEEINIEHILKLGNVVLKVTNGFADNIFITKKYTSNDIDTIKNQLLYHFNREYALRKPSFFHLYSKKRIILEKMFTPIDDLFEFKIMLFNHDIKMIMLNYFIKERRIESYYDSNFKSVKNDIEFYDLSKLNRTLLNEVKSYAIKLSEDFPNFIRVDLYIFHENIYLSELTFDSHAGMPILRGIKYLEEQVKTWKRVDDY